MIENQCTFLNSHGDITISWTEDDHNEMLKVIEKKMEEGYVFYIIEPKFFGLSKKQVSLNKNNIEKLNKNKNILVKDEDLDIFIKQSKKANLSNHKSDDEFNVTSVVKKENINEIDFKTSQKHLIATKPPVGGWLF